MTTSKKNKSIRSSNAKLSPGEDSISRAQGHPQPDGTVLLWWSYRPEDGSKPIPKRSQGRTVGEARSRAREKLEDLRSGSNAWKRSDDILDFLKESTEPAIQNENLSKRSQAQYAQALKMLRGDCEKHRHKHDLRKHTIASTVRFSTLEALLTEVGRLHGYERARQTRNVLNKYVLTRLRREKLIDGNPIAGVELDDLIRMKRGERTRGGKALTRAEYDAVVDYLINLDPAEGVIRRQGRWSIEHLVEVRRNTIDLALFQAATGLRSSEANHATWNEHIRVDSDGGISVQVTKDIAKGDIPRVALVLDKRVAQRLLERRNRAQSLDHYVIGTPSMPWKPWDNNNANKKTRVLYQQIAKSLKIGIMDNERSHLWRTTLHTMYNDGSVPIPVLDSQFGNSEQVRQKHYTDASDMSPLREASNRSQPKPDPEK